MNIKDAVMDEAAKALAKEIDFEVLSSALIESGWSKVVLSPMTWEDGYAVDLWIVDNCKGRHMNMGLVWIFEDEKDASWFKLRWL